MPVCPGHNYQRIPVFLSPVSLNTTLAGVGQWTVEERGEWRLTTQELEGRKLNLTGCELEITE